MTDLVTATELTSPSTRVLLDEHRGVYPPRYEGEIVTSESRMRELVESAMQSEYLVIDFETRGLDYSLDWGRGEPAEGAAPTVEAIGIGLAWDGGLAYVPLDRDLGPARGVLQNLLLEHPRLVAHNVYFDAGFLFGLLGAAHGNWYICTYAFLAHLANEGYPGDGWSLKEAMVECLGWESTNEAGIDEWLVGNGYYMGNRRTETDPDLLVAEYRIGKLRPQKGEMWRVPTDTLAHYCMLDAEATYLLLTRVLLPSSTKFPNLVEFLTGPLMTSIIYHVEQKLWGIPVDVALLQEKIIGTRELTQGYAEAFRTHPRLTTPIAEIERELQEKLITPEPPQFLRERPIPTEPAQLTSKGEPSKNWAKWRANIDSGKYNPIISQKWLNWCEKRDRIHRGELEGSTFNIDSPAQLSRLLYGKLNFEVRERSEKTGDPSTGIKALNHMGDIGKLLTNYGYASKRLETLTSYSEYLTHRDTIHPGFRIPGTMTGRFAGRDPNFHNIEKSKYVMEIFSARPGHVLVDVDFAALESVIAAEFSRDTNMRWLYEDPNRVNDIHLFVGSQVPGEIGERIRASGYDPYNPTEASLAKAKRECKKERNLCKTAVYLLQFGGGAGRLNMAFEAQGIFLPFEQVRTIYDTYHETFSGLRTFNSELRREWRRNGGYILNGLGRPMAIAEEDSKDLVSRFIQSTGHDCLVMYGAHIARLLNERGVHWKPYLYDLHDALTVEVLRHAGKITVDIFERALVELNVELGGDIPLRGIPVIGKTLADVKEAEDD